MLKACGQPRCATIDGSLRPEQLVEQVAEPRLEDGDLNVGDWHLLGPVVGDAPARHVMLGRTAGERPRLAEQRLKLLGGGQWAVGAKLGASRQIRRYRNNAEPRMATPGYASYSRAQIQVDGGLRQGAAVMA